MADITPLNKEHMIQSSLSLAQAPPESRSQCKYKYFHLLYLSESERQAYTVTLGRDGSTPSLRSVRSNASSLSTCSRSTSGTSISMQRAPRFVDDHYPLITTIHPETVPTSVPRSHSALRCARQMAQIHNTIIRALNASWNHSIFVQPYTRAARDFLTFNQQLFKTLDRHHRIEDDYLFPKIDKLQGRSGAHPENTVGHESFAEGLAVFQKYVFITRPSEFCGLTLRHIIESFAPGLVQHLHDEISTLVNLHMLDSDALMQTWKHAQHLAAKDAELYNEAPWILGCQDNMFAIDGIKGDFPGGRWVIEAIIRNWHARKHAGAWKFCPSDLYGRRRLVPVV